MYKKTYLWIEDKDGKSGYTFWKAFMNALFPDVIVESKNNNSELVKAVKKIKEDENRYIIVLDNSFDNMQAVLEFGKIKESIMNRNNYNGSVI